MRAIFHASTSVVPLKLRHVHLHNRVFANSVLVASALFEEKIMHAAQSLSLALFLSHELGGN